MEPSGSLYSKKREITMDQYLVIKTHVDKNDNITTEAKVFYKQIDARIAYFTMIDHLYSQIAFLYSMPFEEFDIEDFGDIVRKQNSFSFKDFEGMHNVKIELKTI
jgi:hypothetical protein